MSDFETYFPEPAQGEWAQFKALRMIKRRFERRIEDLEIDRAELAGRVGVSEPQINEFFADGNPRLSEIFHVSLALDLDCLVQFEESTS